MIIDPGSFVASALREGATPLACGGLRPAGLPREWFFALTYDDMDDAVAIP